MILEVWVKAKPSNASGTRVDSGHPWPSPCGRSRCAQASKSAILPICRLFIFLVSPSSKRKTGPTRGPVFVLLAEWTGLEPATPGVTGRYSNQLNYHSEPWWVLRGSNPRPSPCKGDALPAELSTRIAVGAALGPLQSAKPVALQGALLQTL